MQTISQLLVIQSLALTSAIICFFQMDKLKLKMKPGLSETFV